MSEMIETKSYELSVYARGAKNADKLALVLPGRLDTKDYIHMTNHVDLLASKGFYAVTFDPPYSWDSPGDIKQYSATNYLKAVNELIVYFGNRPTLLIGHSRGGATAELASSNPNVQGLVLVMASYGNPSPPDPKYVTGDTVTEIRDLPPGDKRTAQKKQMAMSMDYFSDAAKYDPVGSLMKFKGPKLMICGSHDEFIKPETVKQVFDSLDEPKVYLELDSDHDYRIHPNILARVNEAIAGFVDKYLAE